MTGAPREIEPMLAQLGEDERAVLAARLGLDRDGSPRTFEEVASLLGRGVNEVREVEAGAIRSLSG